jgi:hypothetical protein
MTIPYRVSKADQYNDESHVASRARGHLSRGRRFAYVLLVSISFSYATNHSISSTKIDRCNDGDDVASRAPSRLAFLFLSLQAHHSPIPSRPRCVTLRWMVPDEWHEHAFTLPINTTMKVTSRAGLVVVIESLSPPCTYKPMDLFGYQQGWHVSHCSPRHKNSSAIISYLSGQIRLPGIHAKLQKSPTPAAW